MNLTCDNCGRPVLETDTVCWHCGRQLPERPRPRASRPAFPGKQASQPATTAYDLRAIAVYGALTLAVIIGLLWVMSSLGRRPLLVRSAGSGVGPDWVIVTDGALRYTLSLPPGWEWLDVPFRQQQAVLEQLRERQPYLDLAMSPLARAAGDVKTLAVSLPPQNPEEIEPLPFVIIGDSARLGGLQPQQALDLAAETAAVFEQTIDDRIAGQAQARFATLDADNAYQCRHLFVTDARETGYLVAACAPQSDFGRLERDLKTILDSFQLLE